MQQGSGSLPGIFPSPVPLALDALKLPPQGAQLHIACMHMEFWGCV